jgi:hypothetical protein
MGAKLTDEVDALCLLIVEALRGVRDFLEHCFASGAV